jgi:diguanylate cyclase (GGDEF)-like protein/PAS domain S-box-containing protein
MKSHPLPTSQARILIVDDSPDNLRVLSATLSEHGYEVRCAKNGSMALTGAQMATPDLILLDVRMPDMNGYEVCQQLKERAQTSDIPVIFLSAMDDVLDKVRAFNVGGVDYITKPFQVEEVLARIKSQLALQSAKAEIHQLNVELEQRVLQRTAQLEATNQELQQEIAERKQTEFLLQESEERFASILNSLDDVVWSLSVNGDRVLYLNPAAEEVYGRPLSDFFNNSHLWLEVIYPDDYPRIWEISQSMVEQGGVDMEYRVLRPDGEVRWLRDRRHIIYGANGIPTRVDGIVYDITDRKRAEERLIHDALHDSLTSLPNRTLFMERVEIALNHAKRHPNYLFAILFIDLDRFKTINDSLGHLMGDRLLIEVSHLLKRCVRHTDSVARLGGDEFTILLDDIKDVSYATKIAQHIQEEMVPSFNLDGQSVFTSASIGIVLNSADYDCGVALLRDADIAMYRAKENGKARYEVFEPKMYAQTLRLSKLENDLRTALDRQEFLLHYQPIVSLTTGKWTGLEALLRWQNPERGLVSPMEFIPVAEDTGAIVPIGEWVLREACRQMRAWQLQFGMPETFKMSVNIASKQFANVDFIAPIDAILAEIGLDGSYLRLEITESMLMDGAKETIARLTQIRERKIHLSIDDFGKGYSSLSYLHRFPINTLKIDRSFVSSMSNDPENFEIASTIITLAHSLGMDAIAEGIETVEQCERLTALGCEMGQGYLFAKPMDRQATEDLLAIKYVEQTRSSSSPENSSRILDCHA